MIISNLYDSQRALPDKPGSFYLVSETLHKYAETVEPLCASEDGQGENDHFTSTMREISRLWSNWQTAGIPETTEKINRTYCLKSWFSMIVCMILFGRNDGNALRIVSVTVQEHPYLKVWKNKFFFTSRDDNAVSEAADQEALHVYAFAPDDLQSLAGCVSDYFFVIPPKAVIPDDTKWKNFYLRMMQYPSGIMAFLEAETNVMQKMLLLLSANTGQDHKPVQMIREILRYYISLKEPFVTNIRGKQIGSLTFFSTDYHLLPEVFFTEKICLLYTENQYAALYPFTQKTAQDIESGICRVETLSMTVTETSVGSILADQKLLDSVQIKAGFCYQLTFLDEENQPQTVPYSFSEEISYSARNIRQIARMRTFCMYPDILFAQEEKCQVYTYLSKDNSFLFHSRPTVPMQEMLDLTELSCFEEVFQNPVAVQFPAANEPVRFVWSVSSQPKHLIGVHTPEHAWAGALLNLRTKEGNYLPLLFQGEQKPISLQRTAQPETEVSMQAYLDFGNSTTAISYRCGGKTETGGISGSSPAVRGLLAEYDREGYACLVNLPETDPEQQIPSVFVRYDSNALQDWLPGHQIFIPFSDLSPLFESMRLHPDPVKKTAVLSGETFAPMVSGVRAFLFQICFAAACHAVNMGCTELLFFPAVPGRQAADVLAGLLDEILAEIRLILKIRTEHLLHAEKRWLLWETLALSADVRRNSTDVLTVTVDIGDAATELSAVFADKLGNKKLCGFSSVPYAGKEILMKTIFDVFRNVSSLDEAESFLFGRNGQHPLLIPEQKNNGAEIIGRQLCQKFMTGKKWRGIPKDAVWEQLVLNLLRRTRINTESPNRMPEKAAALLLIRCAVLLPVIRDFTAAAAMMCGKEESTALNLNFCGGGARNFLLADQLTAGEKNFLKQAQQYLGRDFTSCYVSVQKENSKKQLLKAISRLSAHQNPDGAYVLDSYPELAELQVNLRETDPHELIAVLQTGRSELCSGFAFRPVNSVDDVVYNAGRRQAPSSCIADSEADVYPAYSKYLKQEIFENFLSGTDAEACFVRSFADAASPQTQEEIQKQLYSDTKRNAFRLAAKSDIYPEMIRHTAYLLETSRLLSARFGKISGNFLC